jgi:hypothetical protein
MRPECRTRFANKERESLAKTIYLQLIAEPQNNFAFRAGI